MRTINSTFNNIWLTLFLPVGTLLLSACAINSAKDSTAQYASRYDHSVHEVNGFDVRTVTDAPQQFALVFRIDVEPKEAFDLVADIEKLATWFTDIKNPKIDNTHSNNGPNELGVNSVRTCSLDGEILYEDIVHYDKSNYSYAYSIDMNKSTISFPISNQMSMFTVEPDGKGGSLISWRHYFKKNFHLAAPGINFLMKRKILEPAIENLFDQHGGEWVELNQAEDLV